jgi:hypothetical protein
MEYKGRLSATRSSQARQNELQEINDYRELVDLVDLKVYFCFEVTIDVG